MVNNCININKTNDHLSQLNSLDIKQICDAGNPDPALEQAPKSGGLNQLIGSQPYSLDSWISIGNTFKD